MVAACCRLCYEQYLNPDRTLDEKKLQQSYRKRYKSNDDVSIISVQKSYQPNKTGRFQFLKKMPPPVFYFEYKMLIDDKEINICTCDCHIEGVVCLH